MYQLTKFLASLILKILMLLFLVVSNTAEAQRRSTSVNVSDNGKTTISIKNGLGNNFHIEYKGDITLSDDDTDVIGISNGGYMEIKRSAFGSKRKILIESDGSGNLIKKYYVGGSQRSFDAEGRKWLSEILLEVVRTTTLGAEKRVDRMYRKGGSYAVLNEVDKIESSHVKSRYIKLLLEKNPKSADLISILKAVGQIDSDHHKADILKRYTNTFLTTEEATSAYITTTGNIDSDHHKADVLKKSIRDGRITDTQMKVLFVIAEDINSDHHKASVLLEAMRNRQLTPNNVKLLVNTSKNIDSDHHKATVLREALKTENLSQSAYHTLLNSVENMSSDHHIASIFGEMAKNELNDEALGHLLELVEENMDSDNHRANVLKKVVYHQKLKSNSLDEFLEALTEIDSDHHKAEVFKTLAKKKFTEEQLTVILKATHAIDSDHHKAESLLRFSSTVNESSSAVKEAYRSACMDIDSDSHLGRAIKAVN